MNGGNGRRAAVLWAIDVCRTPEVDLTAPQRWVLVALASYANPDGTNAWPSLSTLARDTGYDQRTVQRALAVLEQRRLVRRRLQAGGPPGMRWDRRPNAYDLIMQPSLPGLGITTGRQPAGGGTQSPRGRTGRHTATPPPGTVSPNQHQWTMESEKEQRVSTASSGGDGLDTHTTSTADTPTREPLSPDWRPNGDLAAFAREHGLDVDEELDRFRDHVAETGRTSADWPASFRRHLRGSADRRREREGDGDTGEDGAETAARARRTLTYAESDVAELREALDTARANGSHNTEILAEELDRAEDRLRRLRGDA